MLGTLAVRRGGWPFTSIAPYALSGRGEPILLLSDLAEHTRNLQADSRASLFVQDSVSREDPQAGARLTLLGHARPADDPPAARERYLAAHPRAVDLLAMADFRFYVLQPSEVRYIGGFGDMGWLPGDLLGPAD